MQAVNDIRPQKIKLRKEFREIRASICGTEKQSMDRKIVNKLFNTWLYREAKAILTYVSMGTEIDTLGIIKRSLEMKKTVAVPCCADGVREIDFYIINSLDELERGAFGVLEPNPDRCEKYDASNGEICVVPALAFDKNGYRLGYGKGYYDRFLSGFKGSSVGLCYSKCMPDYIPRGKYDLKVLLLITEKGVMYT